MHIASSRCLSLATGPRVLQAYMSDLMEVPEMLIEILSWCSDASTVNSLLNSCTTMCRLREDPFRCSPTPAAASSW